MEDLDEIITQVREMLEGTVAIAEELAVSDLGDRLARSNAQLSRKIFDALLDEQFTRTEAAEITAATMGKR